MSAGMAGIGDQNNIISIAAIELGLHHHYKRQNEPENEAAYY
jgi:hypothetical protein